jgi:roadblock/LC7 domain-containing protein
MNEFDELVSRRGVVMAGRLGPDGRIAEHKSEGLFLEIPKALEMAHWFCATVTMMFNTMGFAMNQVEVAGSWLPATGWSYWGGDYAIIVHESKFVFAEAAKVESLDELAGMLRQLDS